MRQERQIGANESLLVAYLFLEELYFNSTLSHKLQTTKQTDIRTSTGWNTCEPWGNYTARI